MKKALKNSKRKYLLELILFSIITYFVLSGSSLMFYLGSAIDKNIQQYKSITDNNTILKDIYTGNDRRSNPKLIADKMNDQIKHTTFKKSKDCALLTQLLAEYKNKKSAVPDTSYIRRIFETCDTTFSTKKGNRVLDLQIKWWNLIFCPSQVAIDYFHSIKFFLYPPIVQDENSTEAYRPFMLSNKELTSSEKSGWIYLAMILLMAGTLFIVIKRNRHLSNYKQKIENYSSLIEGSKPLSEDDVSVMERLKDFPLFNMIHQLWATKDKPDLWEEIYESCYEQETDELNAFNRKLNVVFAWIVRLGILGTLFGVMLAFYEMAQGMMALKSSSDVTGNISMIIKDSMIQALLGNAVAVITSIVAHSATFFMEFVLGATEFRDESQRDLIKDTYFKIRNRPEFVMGFRCRVEEHAHSIAKDLSSISEKTNQIANNTNQVNTNTAVINSNTNIINGTTSDIASTTEAIRKELERIKDTTGITPPPASHWEDNVQIIAESMPDLLSDTSVIKDNIVNLASSTKNIEQSTNSISVNVDNTNKNTGSIDSKLTKIVGSQPIEGKAKESYKKIHLLLSGIADLFKKIFPGEGI